VVATGVFAWQYFVKPAISGERSIVVLSPNGGETLTKGGSYTITWELKGVVPSVDAFVNVFLQRDGVVVSGRLNDFGIPASQGLFYWDVLKYYITTPEGGRTDHIVPEGEGYKIVLLYVWDPKSQPSKSVQDMSDGEFTISSDGKELELQDINFDGYPDVRTSVGYGTIGCVEYDYWIFGLATKPFDRIRSFGCNPTPNAETKEIWVDEYYASHSKSIYKWEDVKLTLVGIVFDGKRYFVAQSCGEKTKRDLILCVTGVDVYENS